MSVLRKSRQVYGEIRVVMSSSRFSDVCRKLSGNIRMSHFITINLNEEVVSDVRVWLSQGTVRTNPTRFEGIILYLFVGVDL